VADNVERQKRYKVWTWDEITADRENRPQWVVPGLITDGTTSITGKSEAGKSMLATALIYALATGRPFLGRKPVKTYRPAVFATDDRGHLEYQERLDLIGREGAPQEVRSSLRVFSVESLLKYEDLVDLYGDVRDMGLDFVVLDNASQMLDGDGNSGYDVNRLFGGIRLFTHAGIPVVIINHQNQQGSVTEASAARGISGNSNWTRNVRHRLTLDKVLDKGKDTRRRRLFVNGNYSEGESLELEMPRGIDRPVYKVTEGQKRQEQKRDPKTMDKNADIARWIKANCPGESIRKQAERAAAQFPDLSEGTIRNRLSGNGPIAQVLKQL